MPDDLSAAALVLGSLLAAVVATWLVPALLRPFFWVAAHALYRFRVHHRERVPADGGVLARLREQYPDG